MSTAAASITCGMCGTAYDPAATAGCSSCPLGAHCSLTCCPACGYSAVDPSASTAARLASRLAGAIGRRRRLRAVRSEATLDGASAGARLTIEALDELPDWQASRLASYGLLPGRPVDVVQASPVVIVQVDHVELVLERQVARMIRVAA